MARTPLAGSPERPKSDRYREQYGVIGSARTRPTERHSRLRFSCVMLWIAVPNRRSMTVRGDRLDRTELRDADIVVVRATPETMCRGVVVARFRGKLKRKDFVHHEEQLMLKEKKLDDFRQELEQACKWLNIDRGRAREYVRLLEDFGRGEHGPEHLLAYYEADEIVQLFELWGNDIGRFPGLKPRLEQACAKGPAMTEDEKTSNSSSKPRNDAFGFLMAGKFKKAGISVSTVDGIRAGSGKSKSAEDFSIRWNRLVLNVECKRPYSAKGFERLAKKGQRQIKKRRRRGIIIMDCSRLARPAGTVFEPESSNAGADALHRWLEKEVEPKLPKPTPRKVLGYILFARIPAMTAIGILDANEQAWRRPDCISEILVVDKGYSCAHTVLHGIAQRLITQSQV